MQVGDAIPHLKICGMVIFPSALVHRVCGKNYILMVLASVAYQHQSQIIYTVKDKSMLLKE